MMRWSWWNLGKSKDSNSKNSNSNSTSSISSRNKREIGSSGGRNTSAWKSIKSACEQYGLTEEDVRSADPPIVCKWRKSNGSSSALVKLSDISALKKNIIISRQQQAQKEKDEKKKKKDEKIVMENQKKRNKKKLLVDATMDFDTLVMKAAEEKKKDIIAKFGQKGCDKILNKSNVVKKAAARNYYYKRRKSAIEDLIDKLDIANDAASISISISSSSSSSSFENSITVSIADTLDGITISERKAKKEWYASVDGLTPVEDNKDNRNNRNRNKKKDYHLSDVIGRAIKTTCSQQPQTTATSHQSKKKNQQQQLTLSRILKCPKRKRLYARYLFDQFEDACQNVDDPSIIMEVYEFRKKRQQQRDDELLFQKKRKTSE
jgi:hypothetical protein